MKREFSAGGVVVRRFRGRSFVAAVQIKQRRGDLVLSLPKGHPSQGESTEETALREVREETGLDAAVLEKLGDVRYWYQLRGERILKVVSFFLCRWRSGSVQNHDREVESALWLPLEDAPERLTYSGEKDMARRALERVRR